MQFDGYLLLDKAKGWTSFDAVAKTRGILKKTAGRKVKIGHTGTLDPIATGLLILVVGSYTKKSNQFLKMDKSYLVTCDLEHISDTHDSEGDMDKVETKQLPLSRISSYFDEIAGEIMQAPPQHSAIKVGGKRAYSLARKGEEVKIEPRPVNLKSYEILDYEWPKLQFKIEVSSGFYVRSLIRDMAEALGSGGVMTDLRRFSVGQFNVADAITVDQLNNENITEHIKALE